jgi:hypothetical protein
MVFELAKQDDYKNARPIVTRLAQSAAEARVRQSARIC